MLTLEVNECLHVLGVDRVENAESLKLVYRQLSKKYHPDLKTGDASKMSKINDAYTTLKKMLESGVQIKNKTDFDFSTMAVKIDVESLSNLLTYGGVLHVNHGNFDIRKDNCGDFNILASFKLTVEIINSYGEFKNSFDIISRYYHKSRSLKDVILNIDNFKIAERSKFQFTVNGVSKELETAASRIRTDIKYNGILIPLVVQVDN